MRIWQQKPVPCFHMAVEIDPAFAMAQSSLRDCLVELGGYEEAIVCYDNTLQIEPKMVPAWASKGISLHICVIE